MGRSLKEIMAAIKIDTFAGIIPRSYPTLLPDGCAVKAHNCRLQSGKLSPLRQASRVTGIRSYLEGALEKIGDAKTLYLWHRYAGDCFLAWENIVKIAQSNLADDVRHRIFVTGKTGVGGTGKNLPCVYIEDETGTSFVRHPLPKIPLAAPAITLEAGEPSDTVNIRYTVFYQSWADVYGYESGVSDGSEEIQYNDGNEITVGAVAAPTGAVLRRIYKVVSGTETESIQFIAEQAVSGFTFPALTFAVKDEDAGEILPTLVSPPEDLSWMSYVPGNFYAGFSPSKPRTVMFSDVDRPTSWPIDYMYDVRDDVVALAVAGNTVFALTEGYTWAFTGTGPEAMSPCILSTPQACISARSVCVLDGAVFYASQDGVCMASSAADYAGTVSVITKKYFSKREWEALNPSTCVMDTYDGALYAWFTLTNGVRQGYMFDLSEGASALVTHDEQAKALFYDVRSDNLYYTRSI